MSKPIDAPLGIVALKEEGPWHIVINTNRQTGVAEILDDEWAFWVDTHCAPVNYTDWRYFRFPANLPPGARLCKRCEAKAAKLKEADDE